ncbi:MAG: B3/4 domain-containing protein [Lentihominibacter sp.]|jgi:DNA/RNA-binding domain of Phe-tRNA-synthetase-like protein
MNEKIFNVDKEIFELFPGLRIVTVVVKDMPRCIDPGGIEELMNEAWQIAKAAAVEYGNPQSHPLIKPWGERMKEAGVRRKQYPSSIEAMVRRAGKTDEPFHINPIVDFYNAVSLKNIMPAGGYDLEDVNECITLRLSAEGDTFCALDSNEEENVPAGEVSYMDGKEIITRHFIWKQSRHCLLRDSTKDILFVSEILGDVPTEKADDVANDLVNGLKKYFGVECRAEIVDENKPSVFA